MTTILLAALVILDVALITAVFVLSRKQDEQGEIVSELTEERRAISEIRQAVTEELESAQARLRATVDRVGHLAAEAEHEVRTGSQTLKSEVDSLVSQLSTRFEGPLKELARRQQYLETLMRQLDQNKTMIQKVIARGEKMVKLFDERIPFEDVIKELEDKKYADARYMISQGVAPLKVARDLGISEQEVLLLAGFRTAPEAQTP
jgi:signal transduction histidine kinase